MQEEDKAPPNQPEDIANISCGEGCIKAVEEAIGPTEAEESGKHKRYTKTSSIH